jgi:large subunit ribosomal protein L25
MKFVAYAREKQGTGASRRLRVSGKVPGIVYGAGEPSMIELDHNALFYALKKEAFHSSLLEMELAGKSQQVLLRDVQMHAYKPLVLHVDFQRVDATTRITKKVPLHFVNEENAPGVKADKGVMSHVATEIEIECLAAQLPEYITVDLGNLAKGQSFHVNDLQLPKDVKVVLRGRKNPVLATVVTQAEEEVQPEVAAAVVPAAKGAAAKPKKDEKQNRK